MLRPNCSSYPTSVFDDFGEPPKVDVRQYNIITTGNTTPIIIINTITNQTTNFNNYYINSYTNSNQPAPFFYHHHQQPKIRSSSASPVHSAAITRRRRCFQHKFHHFVNSIFQQIIFFIILILFHLSPLLQQIDLPLFNQKKPKEQAAEEEHQWKKKRLLRRQQKFNGGIGTTVSYQQHENYFLLYYPFNKLPLQITQHFSKTNNNISIIKLIKKGLTPVIKLREELSLKPRIAIKSVYLGVVLVIIVNKFKIKSVKVLRQQKVKCFIVSFRLLLLFCCTINTNRKEVICGPSNRPRRKEAGAAVWRQALCGHPVVVWRRPTRPPAQQRCPPSLCVL